MNRKRISGLSVLLVLFLLLSMLALGGCDTAAPPDDDDDENGAPAPDPDPDPGPAPDFKTVTHALPLRPFGFDAQSRSESATNALNSNWTDALMTDMPDGTFVMGAAESITQLDELTYEIKIREGITFHNGEPLTADDVVFSITRSCIEGGMEGGTSMRRSQIGPVESAETKDDYTVIVKTERPHDMSKSWRHIYLYPKNYFEEVGLEGFLANPIGIGPFKYVEGTVEEMVVLERYEDYWGGAAELPGDVDRVPTIDRLIFMPVPEAATRVAALMAGDVDVITHVPFDTLPLLQADPNIVVRGVAADFGDDVLTSHKTLHFNTTKYPMSEKEFRHAVAYAINYDEIVEGLYLGLGIARRGVFHVNPFPGDPMHNQLGDLESPYHYNPEKARELLEGFDLANVSVVLDTNTLDVELSQMVAQYLSDVGIDSSVRVWDQATLTATWAEGNRDICIYGRGNSTRQPGDYIWSNLGTGRGTNRSFYSNPYLDEIVQESLALPDSPERLALTIEVIEIAWEDLPQIQLVQPDLVYAHRAHIENFYWNPNQLAKYHRVDFNR